MTASPVAQPIKAPVRLVMTVVLGLGWLAVAGIGVAYAVMLQLLGDAGCEPTPGSSTYGTFEWSILPPGPTCTFTMVPHGFDAVRGPTPVMSIWLLVLAVWAVAIVIYRPTSR